MTLEEPEVLSCANTCSMAAFLWPMIFWGKPAVGELRTGDEASLP